MYGWPPTGAASESMSWRSGRFSFRPDFENELVAVGLLHDAVERGTLGEGGGAQAQTQATVHPTAAVASTKVSGKKLHFVVDVSFPLPPGAQAPTACKGKVKLAEKIKRHDKALHRTGQLALDGDECVAVIKGSLPAASKGKKLKFTISFSGNDQLAPFILHFTVKDGVIKQPFSTINSPVVTCETTNHEAKITNRYIGFTYRHDVGLESGGDFSDTYHVHEEGSIVSDDLSWHVQGHLGETTGEFTLALLSGDFVEGGESPQTLEDCHASFTFNVYKE
jgi:hypothetical protein